MDQTDEEKDRKFEEIKNSKWKQNEVWHIRFRPTLVSTTVTFFIFGAAFILLGILVSHYAKDVYQEIIEYTDCEQGDVCTYNFTVEDKKDGPFIFAYELHGFYQNIRNYIVSRADDQLYGHEVSLSKLKKNGLCEGGRTNKEMGKEFSFNGTKLNESHVAIPCGIMAQTMFNDTYIAFKPNGEILPIDENNIAWKSDRKLFKNIGDDWQSKQWYNMTDEHFIVWMRPSAFSYMRKLWGVIREDLAPGNYSINVTSNYPASFYKGKKYVVITNMNAFGGKNTALGIYYLVVGVGCVLIAIGIFFGYKLYQKKQGQNAPAEKNQDETTIFDKMD